nr:MAG TPA: hypothetical protein [Caudoviricetes sp.]
MLLTFHLYVAVQLDFVQLDRYFYCKIVITCIVITERRNKN